MRLIWCASKSASPFLFAQISVLSSSFTYSVDIVHGMYNFKYYYYTYLMKYLHCIIIEAHPWAFLLMYIKTIAWCMMTRCHLHGFASPTAKGMRTMVGLGKFHPDIRKHLFVQNYNNLPLLCILYWIWALYLQLLCMVPTADS